MLLPIEYRIEFMEGEYHLYLLVGDTCAVLYSAYHYRPCWEVMRAAKCMQRLAEVRGNV
jgi:hypothetical protein